MSSATTPTYKIVVSIYINKRGERKHTALVLAYNLSRKPWSHVLTLYFKTFSTTSRRAALPPPFSGKSKSSNFTSFSGL